VLVPLGGFPDWWAPLESNWHQIRNTPAAAQQARLNPYERTPPSMEPEEGGPIERMWELYDRARYVTVTGEALPGHDRAEIAERGPQLAQLYRRLFPHPEAPPPADYSAGNSPAGEVAGDDELLGRAMRVRWFPAV
jgi:hypothetical protein